MPKCCYYLDGDGDERLICTTDEDCPKIPGWTFQAYWGVGDCEDCDIIDVSGDEDGGGDGQPHFVVPERQVMFLEWLEDAIRADGVVQKLKEIFGDWPPPPRPPIPHK